VVDQVRGVVVEELVAVADELEVVGEVWGQIGQRLRRRDGVHELVRQADCQWVAMRHGVNLGRQ